MNKNGLFYLIWAYAIATTHFDLPCNMHISHNVSSNMSVQVWYIFIISDNFANLGRLFRLLFVKTSISMLVMGL
jgi:hypothetical protein